MHQANDAGTSIHVLVDQTRPCDQDELISWENGNLGTPHACVTDNARGRLTLHGKVDMLTKGTDGTIRRIAICNWIVALSRALAARDNGAHSCEALPSANIDGTVGYGVDEILAEERDTHQTIHVEGDVEAVEIGAIQVSPEGTSTAIRHSMPRPFAWSLD